jgi:site-specific recombinase XerD
MKTFSQAVNEYLALRRALGYKLCGPGTALRKFAAFLEQEKAEFITIDMALRWAKQPQDVQPAFWARRLDWVRRFAQYWKATDPRTEIPPIGLLPHRYHRRTPHIYTDEEITTLLQAAKKLPSKTGLRSWTFYTLFGLLAVAGLRISEVIALNDEDVDLAQGMLTIRQSKFGKSRLVPVHSSTRRVLRRYARWRDRVHPKLKTCSFFVSECGTRLKQEIIRWTFIQLSRRIGLRSPTDSRGPTLHDMRHRFAVTTLLHWYQEGADVEQQMYVLSTYLGHVKPTYTYWYLSAVPELLAYVVERLEKTIGDLP